MKDSIIKYKRIIAVLSALVVCLVISNYVFYNKLHIQSENSLQVVELDNKYQIGEKRFGINYRCTKKL